MRRCEWWVSGLVLVAGLAGCDAPPPVNDPDSGSSVCAADGDCDDGRFCNGAESCMPESDAADARGCVATPPCMDSQRCLEDEDRCVTSCAVNADADGDGVDAVACGGADCDDADPDRFPGNLEVCDAADHDEDCNPSTFGTTDADGDTYVAATCCNTDLEGTLQCGDDCSDSRRDAHPGSTEACEGVDNDCDGMIDEALLVRHYRDADFDLHGVTSETMEVCPGTPGWSLVDDDCDDTSPLRHGAQLEICDEVDNDCDGTVDESPVSISWYPDEDGDGFGAPPSSSDDVVISCAPVDGYSTRSSDCDDTDANVRPGQRELCNGLDDDCNGRADAGGVGAGDTEDDDGDGFADVACGGSDCNDADGSVNRDGLELCNGIDDDCDGVTDGADAMAMWYLDRDRDGWGDPSEPAIESCEPQPGRVARGGDCNDDRADVSPGAVDLCDGADADCDGEIDENGVRFAFYPDADGDGWGTSDRASIVFRCSAPAGTTDRTGDCDDADAERNPAALEQCQSIDDDCDGTIDEDSERMWYADADHDGHGVGTGMPSCMAIAGRAPLGDDCDDADGGNFPGNSESCDGADDDCDGTADEGASSACDAPNATGVCTSAACSLTCTTGYGDCDGDLLNGCEADVRRSPSDCGACGVACGLGDTCGRAPVAAGVCNESAIVELTGGAHYVIGRRATGGTFGWGRGTNGQHGLGSNADALEAGRGQLDGAIDIDGGDGFGCGVVESGAVLCWGFNGNGQLAANPFAFSQRLGAGPVSLPGPAQAVCAGEAHACAALRDGSVYCWGAQLDGRLGNGSTASDSVYTPARAAVAAGSPIADAVDLSCSERSTCVLRERSPGDRYVSCMGSNALGQLGQGGLTPATSGYALDVPALPGDLLRMNRGQSKAHCVLTSAGRVLCWGGNAPNASSAGCPLGIGVGAGSAQPSPVTPPGLDAGVIDVMIHEEGGCAIRRNGSARELLCWGYAGNPSWLGDGSAFSVCTPSLVGPTADRWTDVSAAMAGFQFVCAARGDGNVYCIGQDNYGQLGNGAPATDMFTPQRVIGLP